MHILLYTMASLPLIRKAITNVCLGVVNLEIHVMGLFNH